MWLKPPETRGYIPADREAESVSKTLEYAFDDWCIARLAARLERAGRPPLLRNARRLLPQPLRSGHGIHAASPRRRRLGIALFTAPVAAERPDYTEGNAWQYTWSVMHDVRGLMALLGGPDAFVRKLDESVPAALRHRG